MKTKTLFFLSLLLLFSCKKESDKQSTSIPEPKGEYILGRFGNDILIYTYPNYKSGNPNTPDTICNIAFSDGEIFMKVERLAAISDVQFFVDGGCDVGSVELLEKWHAFTGLTNQHIAIIGRAYVKGVLRQAER